MSGMFPWQLCCLCANFCYLASMAFVSFKHGAFLATLAKFSASLSVWASQPIGRFFACGLHLVDPLQINHGFKTVLFWLMGENAKNICNTNNATKWRSSASWGFELTAESLMVSSEICPWEWFESYLLLEQHGCKPVLKLVKGLTSWKNLCSCQI